MLVKYHNSKISKILQIWVMKIVMVILSDLKSNSFRSIKSCSAKELPEKKTQRFIFQTNRQAERDPP